MKTETSSFRLDKGAFAKFKQLAKKENLTTNSLINKIIKNYVEYGAYMPALQEIPIATPLLNALLKDRSENQIRKIARDHVLSRAGEMMLLLKGEITLDAFLELAQSWCDVCGYTYNLQNNNDSKTMTTRHNQGEKFSILISEIVKTNIEDVLKKRIKITHTANMVSFTV